MTQLRSRPSSSVGRGGGGKEGTVTFTSKKMNEVCVCVLCVCWIVESDAHE